MLTVQGIKSSKEKIKEEMNTESQATFYIFKMGKIVNVAVNKLIGLMEIHNQKISLRFLPQFSFIFNHRES